MAKGPVHVSDGDATFDNTSRIKPKRSHNCDRNISPVEAADDMRRRGIDDNFSEDASVGGTRKVKVNQVKDSDNVMSHTYNRDDLHITTATPAYHKAS
ncbi:hypothetical protein V6N13_119490 [Hibiscus sabdariffa]